MGWVVHVLSLRTRWTENRRDEVTVSPTSWLTWRASPLDGFGYGELGTK
jgi:hypothetical protein